MGIDGLSIGPILLTGFITTLATLAAWPKFAVVLFPDASNVQRSNRIIFFSRPFTFFHHVGAFLFTFFYPATKWILYTAFGSIFSLIGDFTGYGFLWFQ